MPLLASILDDSGLFCASTHCFFFDSVVHITRLIIARLNVDSVYSLFVDSVVHIARLNNNNNNTNNNNNNHNK